MRQNVSTPTTTSVGQRRVGTEETMEEKSLLDFVNDVAERIGETGGYIVGQVRTQPLIYSSLIIGLIGAMVGARIAQIRAMQRRKNAFERMADSIAEIGSIIAARMFWRPMGPIETIRERGREISFGTRMLGMMGEIPGVGIPRPEVSKGPRNAMRQAGYALSLVPITIAFLRNPLVRDFGTRFLFRKIKGR